MSEKFNANKYKTEFANEHYDRLSVYIPKGEREAIKAYAAEHGQSLNAFVVDAIHAKMQ